MNNISKKQAKKNSELAQIKKEITREFGDLCMICRRARATDLMHILPKSIWPEHYTEKWNLIIGCRSCHDMFDSSAAFRRRTGLYEHVKKHDSQGAYKYFQMSNANDDIHMEIKKGQQCQP